MSSELSPPVAFVPMACLAGGWGEVECPVPGALLSEGSRYHWAGKCKPCAFFHTKGCQNGPACAFCHECPQYEAQRRQRVRRQLLRPLQGLLHGSPGGSNAVGAASGDRRSRFSSGSSNASTAAGSDVGKYFSHSRQSSGASSCSTTAEEPLAQSPTNGLATSAQSPVAAAMLWDSGGEPAAARSGAELAGASGRQGVPAESASLAPTGTVGAGCGAVQYVLVPVPVPMCQQDDAQGASGQPAWLPPQAFPAAGGLDSCAPAPWDGGCSSPAAAAGY